ncbi:MAG: hypothetical protein MZV70_20630 [Desulfobacterales bacterium]|nr:hypothetical protein [Desulfobacterales bacterium]
MIIGMSRRIDDFEVKIPGVNAGANGVPFRSFRPIPNDSLIKTQSIQARIFQIGQRGWMGVYRNFEPLLNISVVAGMILMMMGVDDLCD